MPTSFAKILAILDAAVAGDTIGARSHYWRVKALEQFVDLSVFDLKLIKVGNPGASNLVKALRGLDPFGDSAQAIYHGMSRNAVLVSRISAISSRTPSISTSALKYAGLQLPDS